MTLFNARNVNGGTAILRKKGSATIALLCCLRGR